MLACLHALRTWRAQVLVVFACLKCFASSCACMFYELSVVTCLTRFKKLHAWRALKNGILRELHKMTCLACFIKCHAWRASKNGAFGVFHKIPLGVLKVSNFFFFYCVCDHGALVKFRSWMGSDVFNGKQEIAKFIITIFANFVSILNLKFLVWI